MEELNNTQSVTILGQDGFDNLTVIDMGDAISLGQIAEDDRLHDIVIGHDQAEALMLKLKAILG